MKELLGQPLIPQVDYTSISYGSTLLKSLQTEKLPELDLLVREAVQNSSDASMAITEKNSLWIDFTYQDFDACKLCEQLGAVGQALQSTHADYQESSKCLEIRDRHTTGLTGPYRKEDLNKADHGNYFKLIFDSGINQTQAGAGGNWGFGKSVYYRISRAGIVVYYSQIRTGDANDASSETEERLIVTMVEDESKESAILPTFTKQPSGRAWWGQANTPSGTVLPVTNHEDIEAFLSIFNLKPFKKGETGTSVIIPFVDEAKVLDDIIPEEGQSTEEFDRCVWKETVPAYIKHALQKWYAPRIGNKELEKLDSVGKKIRATIHHDGESETLKYVSMDPLFKLVQDLYNAALFSCHDRKLDSQAINSYEIKTQDIRTRKDGLEQPSKVGCIAYVKTTSRQLYGQQAGLDPFILTGNFNNNRDENEPIVMFAREPGMIITYSIDGTWTKGVKAPPSNGNASNNEFIFAFFIPKVTNRFKPDSQAYKEGYANIGEYIRACEDSDHANWEDKAKFKLISKIKANVGRKIAEGIKPAEISAINASASRLSGKLGTALLPTRGLLASDDSPKQKRRKSLGKNSDSSHGARPSFTTGIPEWKNGNLILPFEMGMGPKERRSIRLEAQTEGGTLSPKAWQEKIGGTFPTTFGSLTASITKLDGTQVAIACDVSKTTDERAPLKATMAFEGGGITTCQIECTVPGQVVTGELELLTSDKTIECVLKAD